MKKFSGRIWIAEADRQIVKIDMVANDDISIGLGLVGRVHQGSRLVFSRRKVNGETWLPAEARIDASGRTLLFRVFQIHMRTEYLRLQEVVGRYQRHVRRASGNVRGRVSRSIRARPDSLRG